MHSMLIIFIYSFCYFIFYPSEAVKSSKHPRKSLVEEFSEGAGTIVTVPAETAVADWSNTSF